MWPIFPHRPHRCCAFTSLAGQVRHLWPSLVHVLQLDLFAALLFDCSSRVRRAFTNGLISGMSSVACLPSQAISFALLLRIASRSEFLATWITIDACVGFPLQFSRLPSHLGSFISLMPHFSSMYLLNSLNPPFVPHFATSMSNRTMPAQSSSVRTELPPFFLDPSYCLPFGLLTYLDQQFSLL